MRHRYVFHPSKTPSRTTFNLRQLAPCVGLLRVSGKVPKVARPNEQMLVSTDPGSSFVSGIVHQFVRAVLCHKGEDGVLEVVRREIVDAVGTAALMDGHGAGAYGFTSGKSDHFGKPRSRCSLKAALVSRCLVLLPSNHGAVSGSFRTAGAVSRRFRAGGQSWTVANESWLARLRRTASRIRP